MRVSGFKYLFLIAAFLFSVQSDIFGQTIMRQPSFSNQKDLIIAETKFEGLDSETEFDAERRYRFYKSNALRIFREEKIKATPGVVFDKNETDKAIAALKEWFDSHGFLDAEIKTIAELNADKSVTLTFLINKGSESLVSEIAFKGNKAFTNKELVAAFKQDADWQIFDKNYYQYRLLKNTLDFVKSKGYLAARFGAVETQRTGNTLNVSIPIDEGIRYRYGKIEINDTNALSSQEIINLLGGHSGTITDGKRLLDFFYSELKEQYAAKGYIKYSVDIEPEFLPVKNPEEDGTVNLKIIIDEGERFRLNQIVFPDVDEQTAKMLRQKININDNDFYNQEEFEKGIEEINKLNLYREIDTNKDVDFRTVNPPIEEKPNERPILKKKGDIRINNRRAEKTGFLMIRIRLINQ